MLRTCGTCAIWKNGACALTNRQIPEDRKVESFCDNHRYSVNTCDFCGSLIDAPFQPGIIIFNEKQEIKLICRNCYSKEGTCLTCTINASCALNNDNTMPRYVNKVVRQGNMTLQTQVLNPDLVAKHCPSCKCYENGQCARQKNSCCSNYDSVFS